MAEPSVSGVYPHHERTISTLFKIVVFMISNCGCLYSAIGVVRGFNYHREKRGDVWLGCVGEGGEGVGVAMPLGRMLGDFSPPPPIIPTPLHTGHEGCTAKTNWFF